MKKLMRLLAVTLAAAMLLSVGAMAAENEDGGSRLVFCWLDWNEEGAYASDDALSGRSYGDEEMHMSLGDDYAVIFFTIGEDGKRTPVIPKAGDGVTIEKLAKEEIASGAKQSRYYVRVHLDDWADTELTSGKAAMKVVAELPQVGFYTTAEATRESYLRNDQQPFDLSQLPDKTAYFISIATDEDHGRHVTGVKKDSYGNPSMYDLEKVSDNAWKIVMKAEDGGVGVNLVLSWLETNGSAYDDRPGYWFEYPQGPELWLRWLDWGQDGWYVSDEAEAYGGFQPHPGDECNLIFYACDYDDKGEQTLTPVLPKDLKGSTGVTITDISDQSTDKLAKYFVCVTVADWEKDYTITSGDYTMKFDSNLPDFGIYSKPELTTDSYLNDWKFSPVDPKETVYIGSYIPEGDDRYLADLKLAEFENSDQFTLEKYDDQFYKLTRKSINVSGTSIEFEGAWGWPDGHTEPAWMGVWTEPYTATLVSEKPFTDSMDNLVLYDSVKDSMSNSITLKAGETKTVYVAHMYFREDWGGWRVMTAAPINYSASDGLKLEAVSGSGYPPKYTVSSNTPGEYQIGIIENYEWLVYDEDGKEISDDLAAQVIYPDYDFETGEWSLVDYSKEEPVPYENDVRIEFNPGKINPYWYPVAVTVTGEAPKPVFPDVADSAWYAPAVAFANSNGYMNGNADGSFNPDGRIKGAEFAQILYNKEGKPAAADGASFDGVTTQWYAPAILWAAGKGIVTDAGDAATAPEANLTRQQIALMLYNYMDKPAASADLSGFADADQISGWAREAMEWAVSVGVLKGSDNGGALSLNPTGTATRAQAAQILMNFFG